MCARAPRRGGAAASGSILFVPSHRQFVASVLGSDTHAWEYGKASGYPVILVHGFRGDHHGLAGIASALSTAMPKLRVIVPDLPGFGDTPSVPGRTHNLELYGEWLRDFIAAVAPGGTTILGHSFGSLVVSSALAQGAHSNRAILINPISAPALEGPQALLTQLTSAYYRAADLLPEKIARSLLRNRVIVRGMSAVMAKTRDPELRRRIHAQHDQYFSRFSSPRTLLEAFRASVSHTVLDFAHAFTMPTLIIAGEQDDITPLPKQLDLVRQLPHAQLHIVQGSGHLVHYEAVPETVWWVRDFLRSEELEGESIA